MLGIILVFLLFILMIVEISILSLWSPKISNKPIENIGGESREYSTRSLIFAGLVFTGITLLISSFSDDLKGIEDSLIILIYSLGLFLISYKIEVMTEIKAIYWNIQDKMLNWGFLSMILSLVVFFYVKLYNQFIVGMLILFFIILLMIHFKELKDDLEVIGNIEKFKKE